MGLDKDAPLHPQSLAEHLGVMVFTPSKITGMSPESLKVLLHRDKDSWSAITVSVDGTEAIIHNSSHSKARQTSDIMHELAHIIIGHQTSHFAMAYQDNEELVLRSYNADQEEEAEWLSGCLLLPRNALLIRMLEGMNSDEICTKYGVSSILLKMRINKTGINAQLAAISR